MNTHRALRRNPAAPRITALALIATACLSSHSAWAVFDSAEVPIDSNLKVVRVVPEGDGGRIIRREIIDVSPTSS